jgi:hypothetical protein
MKEFAVCFSGQPRCINESYKDFVKLFDGLDYDIFAHIWDSEELLSSWGHNMGFENRKTKVHKPQEFIDLFQPKNYIIEEYNVTKFYDYNIDSPGYRNPVNKVWSSYSQFYSIMKSFEALREYETQTNSKYKYIVKYRMDHDVDFEFSKLFTPEDITNEWSEIKEKLDNNPKVIITNPGYDWPNGNGISNLLAMGNSDAMYEYSKTFEYYPWLLQNCKFPDFDEANLKTYLKDVCRFDLDVCNINVGVYR